MISLELVTLIGSTLIGGVLKIWGQSIAAKKEHALAQLSLIKAKGKLIQQARKVDDSFTKNTRRWIVLMSIFAIVVWPLMVPVFSNIDVTNGWMSWSPGWLWFDGTDEMMWHTVKGLVITPMHTQLVSAIAGLYLGASIVKER